MITTNTYILLIPETIPELNRPLSLDDLVSWYLNSPEFTNNYNKLIEDGIIISRELKEVNVEIGLYLVVSKFKDETNYQTYLSTDFFRTLTEEIINRSSNNVTPRLQILDTEIVNDLL